MNTQEYWKDRFERLAEKEYAKGDKSLKELNKIFSSARKEMNEKIDGFYSKYGVIKESPKFKTLKDGTEVIVGHSKKLVVPKTIAEVKLKEGTRLTKLNKELKLILMKASKEQSTYMKMTLGEIARDTYYNSIYTIYSGVGVGTSFDLLSDHVVNQLIYNPVHGQDFKKRIWNNRDKLANQVNQTLNNGIIQGLSNKKMTQELSKNMKSGYGVAKRLIQTEVTNTYNQATMAGYKESGIVEKYEYSATLDRVTSDICADLDGKKIDLKNATVGLNLPPMHPNCRSSTTAYFDESNKAMQRMARNPEDGKNFYVPDNMTSRDFKDIYVDKNITRAEWDKSKR